jgi:selenide,water dikinase
VLLRHGAQGCTDVTGFGLLGHLGEMLRASRVAAVVTLERVPVLAGALALAGLGVESSLASSNARVLADFERGSGVDDAALRLLVDPQTSGGLLAGVEAGRAAACVAELRSCGYDAAVIGSVCAGVAGRGRIVCNG